MKKNVLVFPAGEINSIELHDALAHSVNVGVYGASSVERHGSYVFRNYRGNLPLISEGSFIKEFNALINEWKIDFVFPTHDTVALYLAEHQKEIKAKIIVASLQTALICRSKRKTYDLFKGYGFCPTTYTDLSEFPVFIKPDEGQGAKDAQLVRDKGDCPIKLPVQEYVICEYLPGKELTVDCITDSNGKLCVCLPRSRDRLMAGVCVSGKSLAASDEIWEIAERINDRLNFLGLWYFQIKQDKNGIFKLLEISTRCAGTMCLSRARGINLPLLSVYAAMGKDITIFENPYTVTVDRTLISRYSTDYSYDKVYVDYDDTVVEGDAVCLPVITFLYQCRNKGKRITLITRHEVDHDDSIETSLASHAISATLFDEILRLDYHQEKRDYVDSQKSIFIDNAYAERKKIHDSLGIPVFDVEGIEVLADWRS